MWKERFIDYLRYEKNYSTLTEISYLKDIIQFEKFIKQKDENLSLITVDSSIFRIWISNLIELGFKPSSVNRKLSSLKSFYKYLTKSGLIEKNPIKSISGPKLNSKIPSFASEKQMDEILDDPTNFSDDFIGVRNQLLIEFLYLTGMRRAEIISLKDTTIFQTEKQLKDLGDKIPSDKKAPIEAALSKLKEAHKAQDLDAIDAASNELNAVFQAASQEMYNATNAQQEGQPGADAGQQSGGENKSPEDNVTDVDFEEVK